MMSIPEQIILKFKESPHYSYPDSINQLMLNATMLIDYMMRLLGDVIFFKTPVERPDI